jgi:hypothetical protein
MEVEASGAISYSERRLAGIAVVQEEIGLSIAGEIAQPQEGVPRGQRVGQISEPPEPLLMPVLKAPVVPL